MEKIASFTVDHLRLLRGIYVSRRDVTESGDVLTTFDIRMTEPNRMPALAPKSLHAMEHLAATFLRNHPEWKDRVVYWGPMGCCTGNYLILKGDLQPTDILPLMREVMDCGNYTFMDLSQAKADARRYLTEVLAHPAEANLNYPSSAD